MPFITTIRTNYNQDKIQDDIPFDKKYIITGGNTVYTVGGYRIHMFTEVGDHEFKVEYTKEYAEYLGLQTGAATAVGAEYLVIAGGASGGNSNSTNGNGGGGAGGYIAGNGVNVVSGPVTVGDGGNPVAPNANARNPGGPSSAFGVPATGGGGGGSYQGGLAQVALPGGSGGGSGGNPNTAGDGLAGQGNPGRVNGWFNWTGTGGGGASTAGGGGSGFAADGGRGLNSSITGSPVTRAGGGGGGGNSSEPSGDGYDGGGKGYGSSPRYGYNVFPASFNPATNSYGRPTAVPNTGGGGGAGSYWSPNAAWPTGSGKGGTGLVVIRYPFS